jgi:hypothetical protein
MSVCLFLCVSVCRPCSLIQQHSLSYPVTNDDDALVAFLVVSMSTNQRNYHTHPRAAPHSSSLLRQPSCANRMVHVYVLQFEYVRLNHVTDARPLPAPLLALLATQRPRWASARALAAPAAVAAAGGAGARAALLRLAIQ